METNISVLNGVKIRTDNNVIHFEPIQDDKQVQNIEVDDRNWFRKLWDWWTNANVQPYVKIRNQADPFHERTDFDAGCDGKIRN